MDLYERWAAQVRVRRDNADRNARAHEARGLEGELQGWLCSYRAWIFQNVLAWTDRDLSKLRFCIKQQLEEEQLTVSSGDLPAPFSKRAIEVIKDAYEMALDILDQVEKAEILAQLDKS